MRWIQIAAKLAVLFLILWSIWVGGPARTEEPYIAIDVEFDCDNRDSATDYREPIVSDWSGSYVFEVGAKTPYITFSAINETGKVRTSEQWGATTHGRHDHWFGPDVPIDGHSWTVIVYIDGDEVDRDSTSCVIEQAVTPPVHVDPAPRPEPPSSPRVRLHVPRPA